MKKTNKLISILLVLAMLLSVTPLSFITSAAAEITPTEPTLTTDKYDVNGDDTKLENLDATADGAYCFLHGVHTLCTHIL